MRCEVGTRSLQYRAWLTLLCEDLVTGTLTPSITTPGSILTIVYSATRQVAGQHNIGIVVIFLHSHLTLVFQLVWFG